MSILRFGLTYEDCTSTLKQFWGLIFKKSIYVWLRFHQDLNSSITDFVMFENPEIWETCVDAVPGKF